MPGMEVGRPNVTQALHQRVRRRGAHPVVYWLARAVLQPFFHLYFGLSRMGREHIPERGPVIFAANHRSFLDPFVIGMLVRRPVYYMAKKELFEGRWIGWLLSALGAFPVDRGAHDEDAMASAREILGRGDCVVIFPEGTRVRPGSLGALRRGVGRLALETGAPVVPVAVIGTEDIRRGWRVRPRRVRIRCGRPLTFSGERAVSGHGRGGHPARVGLRDPAVGVAGRNASGAATADPRPARRFGGREATPACGLRREGRLACVTETRPGAEIRSKADVDREFSDLYRSHLRDVYSYAYYRVGNHHDAEDLTEQTFLQAYRHFERATRESAGRPLRPWLIRIAHNLAANLYRDRSRKPQTPIDDTTHLAAVHTTEDLVEGRDELARVLQAVGELPDDRREALIMRFALGMDNREIARALGRSDGATKVLIHRAIKQLEGLLAVAGEA